MSDSDRIARAGPQSGDDDAIARLLRLAGPRQQAPEVIESRVKAAVRAHWQQKLASQEESEQRQATGWRWQLSWRTGAALAAAAVIVVGLGIRYWQVSLTTTEIATVEATVGEVQAARASGAARPLSPSETIGSGTEVVTGSQGRAALRLASGHSVRLDHDTRLHLVSASIVRLASGAVYIDSGHEPGASLEVQTTMGVARDIGTQFEVRLDGGRLLVRVREGSVRLDCEASRHEARAGSELLVEADGTLHYRTVPQYGEIWDWLLQVAPPFELEGASLAELLDWVARETGWTVRATDQASTRAIATLTLHGSLAGITPAQAPAAVRPTCNLGYHVSDRGLAISSHDKEGGRPDG
jgi:ferric-dicitrate binding protein FerR (iron transport regulator)